MSEVPVSFTQIQAVQVTDVIQGYMIDIVYALDKAGRCWRNIAGKGWELHHYYLTTADKDGGQ